MRLVRSIQAVACAAAFLAIGTARAQPPADTAREVEHLLDYVARADCQFNRNGTWHQGPAARAHLKQKFDYLAKRNQVPTAEAFIERAATASSISGTAYQVRCGNGAATASGPWLSSELRRYRAGATTPAAR
jgi:hypothetical protein